MREWKWSAFFWAVAVGLLVGSVVFMNRYTIVAIDGVPCLYDRLPRTAFCVMAPAIVGTALALFKR